MGEQKIEQFLSHLAVQKNVSPSTQNQALNALVFLFREVLKKYLSQFRNIRWAQKPRNVPVLLTVEEVQLILKISVRGYFVAP